MAKKRSELVRFAKRLKELRTEAGLTQVEMAEACGWGSHASYAPYELALTDPSLTVLKRMCKALRVKLSAFDDV